MMVESLPTGVVLVDGVGTIVLVNRETERLFGYSREELVGRSVDLLVPGRLRAGHDVSGVHKDGSDMPLEIGLNPIEAEEGVFVLASVIDIGSRSRAEAELRRSNEELEQFAYVASHDLQEPLRIGGQLRPAAARRYAASSTRDATEFIGFAVGGVRADAAADRGSAGLLARRHARSARFGRPTCEPAVDGPLADLARPIEESGATVTARSAADGPRRRRRSSRSCCRT